MDIWVASIVLAIRKILLWTFLYTFLCGYMFSLFLVIYTGVEFGGCMSNYVFTFWGSAKRFLTIFNLLVSFAILFLTPLLLSFVSVPFYKSCLALYFLCSLPCVLIFKSLVPCLVVQSCLTLCNPWTVAHQPPLSTEFSRKEYWSGLPCLLPGDLPNPGIKPRFDHALQADSLPLSH